MTGKKVRTLRERLLSRAIINPGTGCWEWTGSKDKHGYGRISVDGTPQLVHRVAWEILCGPLPPFRENGTISELDHLCRVHCCLNPDHLELVTHQVNMQRGDLASHNANAAKTHCPKGHPYDAENTYVNPRGKRFCRACYRDRDRAARAAAGAGAPPATRTHCPKGHPYDAENTYRWISANGQAHRVCRTCNRVRALARSRALRDRA